MNIYRNKENGKLYRIEHLILSYKHLNRNANIGIYATPYNWKGQQIIYKNKDKNKCKLFVKNNFNILYKLK